jgi:3-carboxy-cis,cis-muconate cycloisomerase
MRLYDGLFRYDEVQSALSENDLLQKMLDFEAALAESEAELGIIPKQAASVIARCCDMKSLDIPALSSAAAKAGNIAIPLIGQLTTAVQASETEASRYVHWGATSQDVIDTALVLQSRNALRLVRADLDRSCEALARLTREHRDTVMAGRTWLQHAAPITFGFKTATMLSSLLWHRIHLRHASEEFEVLQLGGSVGTLAGLGDDGPQVAEAVARKLGLATPTIPWHTTRERVANLATALGILCGTLGKIARDISLLAQTEVAEVSEHWESDRGGSSTMPQKRNPVETAMVLSLVSSVPGIVSSVLGCMIQEHERTLGGWQAEWEMVPQLINTTAAALHHSAQLLNGLKIDVVRMRSNLELTAGAIYAEAVSLRLAEKIGKSAAHRLVAAASTRALERRQHLRSVLLEDPNVTAHLKGEEINGLFDPLRCLGSAHTFIDAVLTEYEDAKLDATC